MPGGGPSHCAGGRDNLSSGAVDGLANVIGGALDGEGVGKVGIMTGAVNDSFGIGIAAGAVLA